MKDKKYGKVRNYCHCTSEYRGAKHSICNLNYSVFETFFIVSPNRSNYDYEFIIKELAKESEKQISCFGKKCITFSVPVEKEVIRIDKNREKITKNISYSLQFIESVRFVASSLSNLVNNLFEGIHKIKCNYGHDDKKC